MLLSDLHTSRAAAWATQVIKLHKTLENKSPLVMKKSFEELPAGNNRGTRPFILRRGKNVMKNLFKEESLRTEVQSGIEKLKENLQGENQTKIQVSFLQPLASKVRQEILSLIPGETDWPFWNEKMLSGALCWELSRRSDCSCLRLEDSFLDIVR